MDFKAFESLKIAGEWKPQSSPKWRSVQEKMFILIMKTWRSINKCQMQRNIAKCQLSNFAIPIRFRLMSIGAQAKSTRMSILIYFRQKCFTASDGNCAFKQIICRCFFRWLRYCLSTIQNCFRYEKLSPWEAFAMTSLEQIFLRSLKEVWMVFMRRWKYLK